MKFLIDMNLPPSWVGFLTEAGFEAVHWSSIGADDASDSEIFGWAAAKDHIVLTCDLDFGAILAATRARRPSVLQIRSELLIPHAIGQAVLAAIRQARQELLDGAIVSVDAARVRLRVLPLPEQLLVTVEQSMADQRSL
jgi:predicted nuclease of predicted toxin-antitoxin system